MAHSVGFCNSEHEHIHGRWDWSKTHIVDHFEATKRYMASALLDLRNPPQTFYAVLYKAPFPFHMRCAMQCVASASESGVSQLIPAIRPTFTRHSAHHAAHMETETGFGCTKDFSNRRTLLNRTIQQAVTGRSRLLDLASGTLCLRR